MTIPLDAVSSTIRVLTGIIAPTWSVRVHDPYLVDPTLKAVPPTLYCFWHASLIPLFRYLGNARPGALVSLSRDGRRLSAILERWGYTLIRGSSSKGGAEAIRACAASLTEKKQHVVITPDGPRGPAGVAKSGTSRIAFLTGCPVVSVRLDAKRAWRLSSWDRFIIPRPFSRIDISFGRPILPAEHVQSTDAVGDITAMIQSNLGVP